jgi:undecaprenyl-diphosphatase
VYTAFAALLFIYLYIRKGNLMFALQALLVLVIAGGLSFLLKDLIERPRPEAVRELGIRTYSFPSGHSMSAIAFYGFLIYLSLRIYKSKVKKIAYSLLLVLVILSVGVSRVYLQVHYPSDVLAGFAAGGICLLIFILVFAFMRFWQWKKGEDTQPDTAEAGD